MAGAVLRKNKCSAVLHNAFVTDMHPLGELGRGECPQAPVSTQQHGDRLEQAEKRAGKCSKAGTAAADGTETLTAAVYELLVRRSCLCRKGSTKVDTGTDFSLGATLSCSRADQQSGEETTPTATGRMHSKLLSMTKVTGHQ